MKDEAFVTILGWMRNILDLRGNRLTAFALVYGFSQDGESQFMGTVGYVADWMGVHENTARNVLQELTDEDLVVRTERPGFGKSGITYAANLPFIEQIRGGGYKICRGTKIVGGGTKFVPNNIDSNNSNLDIQANGEKNFGAEDLFGKSPAKPTKEKKVARKKRKVFQVPTTEEAVALFLDKLTKKKIPNAEGWANYMGPVFIEHYSDPGVNWCKSDGKKLVSVTAAVTNWVTMGLEKGRFNGLPPDPANMKKDGTSTNNKGRKGNAGGEPLAKDRAAAAALRAIERHSKID